MTGAADTGPATGCTDGRRLRRLLPYGLLVLATGVAVVARPTLGDAAADVPVTVGAAAVTAAWMAAVRGPGPVRWGGRTALAFVLCWLNPFFAIFAWVGFLDVFSELRGRWRHLGLVAVAVTTAGAQSGGLPPDDLVQATVFGALILVNVGLAGWLGRVAERTAERADELQRLNDELTAALADNAALHEQLLAQARTAGVQEERGRLAREIHDTLAQSLAGIVTQLEAAVGGDRQERALRLARQALVEARRSVLDLAPDDIEGAGLPDALGSVVRSWSADRELRCDLVVTGPTVPLHPEVEVTVLRVARESLTNVAKHAVAGRVGVTLSYDGDEIVLDVRDDGAGFDPAAEPAPSSFGLRGMRQRAARLAGELTVESRPGSGTAISLRLPALAREAA